MKRQAAMTGSVQVNDPEGAPVIHAMRSMITSRGQTVVPAPIRERFGLGLSTRLEWIVERDRGGLVGSCSMNLNPVLAPSRSAPISAPLPVNSGAAGCDPDKCLVPLEKPEG